MKNKLKTVVFGSLVAGSLIMSAMPAIARDWRGHDRNTRWYDRGSHWGWNSRESSRDWNDREFGRLHGSQSDYQALEQARQQALYDASHHASRKKIAQDDAVVDEIVSRMRYGR